MRNACPKKKTKTTFKLIGEKKRARIWNKSVPGRGHHGQMSKTQRDRDCTFEEAKDAPWVTSKSVHSRFSRNLESLLGNFDPIIRLPKGSQARFSSIADAERTGWIRGRIRLDARKENQFSYCGGPEESYWP